MFGYNVRFAFRVISDRKYGLLSEYSIHNVKKKVIYLIALNVIIQKIKIVQQSLFAIDSNANSRQLLRME